MHETVWARCDAYGFHLKASIILQFARILASPFQQGKYQRKKSAQCITDITLSQDLIVRLQCVLEFPMPVRPSLVARPHLGRQPTSLTALPPLAVTQYYRPWTGIAVRTRWILRTPPLRAVRSYHFAQAPCELTTPLTLSLWRSDGCAEKTYCLKTAVPSPVGSKSPRASLTLKQ